MVYFVCILGPRIDKGEFFKISNSLSNALKSFDNIVLAGDLNIDLLVRTLQIICVIY